MSLITETQIRQALVDYGAFERGRAYFAQGRARILSHRFDGGAHWIESEVRGSLPQPYRQAIQVRARGGGVPIVLESECTCPMGLDCKHVAAALLALREKSVDPFEIPQDVEQWLARVSDVARRASNAYPGDVRQRALYTLDVQGGAVRVRPLSVRLDSAGRNTGRPKLIDAGQAVANRAPAKYLRASDLAVLGKLAFARRWSADDYDLKGDGSGAALASLVATGRCHWRTLEGLVLRPGPEREVRAAWAADGAGRQRFVLQLEQAEGVMLDVSPPMYLDVDAGLIGAARSDLPPLLAEALLAAPPVPGAVAEDVAERLAKALAPLALAAPLPKAAGGLETLRVAPKPVARLALAKVRAQVRTPNGWRDHGYADVPLPVLQVGFDYAGVRFAAGDPRRAALVPDDPSRRVLRDIEAEQRWLAGLDKRRLRRLEVIHPLFPDEAQRRWFSFGRDAKPNDFAGLVLGTDCLEAQGWSIETDPEFGMSLAHPDDDWRFEVDAAEPADGRIDWFDLALGVRVDGERMDILPVLRALIAALPETDPIASLRAQSVAGARNITAPLADGRLLVLPLERLLPIVEGLLEVWRPEEIGESGARLSRFEAESFGTMRELVGQAAAWSGEAPITRLAEAFRGWRSRAPALAPATFKASLRPYQQTGLDWLQMLGSADFGGVLADEMGLGKTVQMLAHLDLEKAQGRLDAPALVVAPTSVLPNWRVEAERFAPALATLVLRGPERALDFPRIAASDLVITSYPLLARDREVLVAQRYSVAVLDEGQIIRNPATAAAQAAFALNARQRVVLSGTPMENHLGDIWSLMRFLNPGLLGDAKSFVRRFRRPIENRGDEAARARLARRLRPFLLRRTIAEVASELPAKSEVEERIELTPTQGELYESTRLVMDKRVREALSRRGLARSSVVVLDALLKLRQVCCDPRLVPTASATARAGGSSKLARLVELVEELCAEGRPTLVFSQFTSMLKLIAAELTHRGLGHVWLTGDTLDRETPVRRFQAGEVGVFLISLKAGGVGLNLTRAETVILYDPWWNPAVEAQAIGRARRIGQQNPVFVHRLIALGTIEEKMLRLQATKRDLAGAIWSEDAATLGALTEDDIRQLFA